MSIISVNNLTYYYDGCDEAVYENASFTLDTTWKTGLIGRNGRGKTTLLKLLTGEFENGGAVIVDYKTDRVENEKALIDRYSAQLNLYAKAFEKILNMSVKQKIIYSFHLSKAITL